MFIFQARDIFFQALHPAATLTYLAVVVAGAVVLTHPFYLLALFLSVFAALVASGGMEGWLKSSRFFLFLIVMILAINLLINKMGQTVLLRGPALPVLGEVVLTLETAVYSLVMGIRLLAVFTAFMLYNYAVNPDQALSLFARLFPRSALLVALATKTIPSLFQKLQSAEEIARCRGVNFRTASRFARIKNRLPLIRVLVISSLEESFNIGESIQARAYGSGRRTSYFHRPFRPGDVLVMASSSAALLLLTLSIIRGWGGFSFYPRLDEWILSRPQGAALLGTGLFLMIPVLPAWGWRKWNFIRWKI